MPGSSVGRGSSSADNGNSSSSSSSRTLQSFVTLAMGESFSSGGRNSGRATGLVYIIGNHRGMRPVRFLDIQGVGRSNKGEGRHLL